MEGEETNWNGAAKTVRFWNEKRQLYFLSVAVVNSSKKIQQQLSFCSLIFVAKIFLFSFSVILISFYGIKSDWQTHTHRDTQNC